MRCLLTTLENQKASPDQWGRLVELMEVSDAGFSSSSSQKQTCGTTEGTHPRDRNCKFQLNGTAHYILDDRCPSERAHDTGWMYKTSLLLPSHHTDKASSAA